MAQWIFSFALASLSMFGLDSSRQGCIAATLSIFHPHSLLLLLVVEMSKRRKSMVKGGQERE